jgi:signal transduction histidine kinase
MIKALKAPIHFRTKLTILFMVVSAIAIAILCTGVVVYEISTYRGELVERHQNLLRTVNSNVAAALVFDDQRVITENLNIYRYQGDLLAVAVFDNKDNVLGSYSAPGPVGVSALSGLVDVGGMRLDGAIFLQENIGLQGDVIGYSRAIVSLSGIDEKISLYIRLGMLAVAVTLIASFAAARIFASALSKPVEDLVDTAKLVSHSGDYSQRVQPRTSDEIGELAKYFNEMLGEIERRDKGLHRQKFSLERLVESKTREIQAALDISEAASQAKSEFLANMSHELRTPLNAILGFSEVMILEAFGPHANEKYKDYSQSINESGAHLLDIINDLLDLAKVEAGQTELRLEEIDVTTIATEVIEMMAVWAQRKEQKLSLRISDELPHVECDRRMIKQVLVNLVSNAVKFTPDNGEITVTLEKPEGDYVRAVVADTGRGMTSDEIKVAMLPFGQAQSILSRSHEGTGLGLPLVEQFLDLHNAKMQIKSEPGEGTEVSLMLPIKFTGK